MRRTDASESNQRAAAARVGTALRAVRGERSEAAGGMCAASETPTASLTLARRTARSAVPTRLRRSAAVLLALAILCGRAFASSSDFEAANQAYDQGKFSEAKAGYEKLAEAAEWSANLFYNLGNADYRLGAPGRAMLDYERALALDPAHPEARANLAVLRKQTGARGRAAAWEDAVFVGQSLDVWTAVAAATGWLAIFGLALIFTSKRGEKSGLWLTTIAAVLVCAYAAGVLWWRGQESALAIVVAQQTEARLAPADSAGLAEALPAGSRVQVLSERGEWIYCVLPGAGRGWIPQQAVERVRLGGA